MTNLLGLAKLSSPFLPVVLYFRNLDKYYHTICIFWNFLFPSTVAHWHLLLSFIHMTCFIVYHRTTVQTFIHSPVGNCYIVYWFILLQTIMSYFYHLILYFLLAFSFFKFSPVILCITNYPYFCSQSNLAVGCSVLLLIFKYKYLAIYFSKNV